MADQHARWVCRGGWIDGTAHILVGLAEEYNPWAAKEVRHLGVTAPKPAWRPPQGPGGLAGVVFAVHGCDDAVDHHTMVAAALVTLGGAVALDVVHAVAALLWTADHTYT